MDKHPCTLEPERKGKRGQSKMHDAKKTQGVREERGREIDAEAFERKKPILFQ
jgi:hypothetical protein